MHWIRFNECCARHSTRGQIRDVPGVHAAWSHTSLIVKTDQVGERAADIDCNKDHAILSPVLRPRTLPRRNGAFEPD